MFELRKAEMKEQNKKAMRKLCWVILVTIIFVGAEIMGGLYSHSIAIMSDAAHLISDALGIGISVVALKIGERSSNQRYSFGYHRAEIIGAISSILFIWAMTIWLIIEATYRFF
jgi:solute carrier family 30 (zinc transporter), member 2